MPGRQSTGPPAQRVKKSQPSRKGQKRSLNAFAIAGTENLDEARLRRGRLGELENDETKRRKEASDDNEDDHEEDARPRSKRLRVGDRDKLGNEVERGSDSEGNEWVVGQVGEDDDSSVNSDEAFGESDEERFSGLNFRGGHSQTGKGGRKRLRSEQDALTDDKVNLDEDVEPDEGADSGEESDNFAENAVDLADVLDQSDSEDSAGGVEDRSDSDARLSDISMSDAEAVDTKQLSKLRAAISSLPTGDPKERSSKGPIGSAQASAKRGDTGISHAIGKEGSLAALFAERDSVGQRRSKGKSALLAAPLPRRQQDRLDRVATFEKSKETLNRWIDTIAHNRRAEHLSFPLVDHNEVAEKDASRLKPTSHSQPANELEATISKILMESRVGGENGKTQEEQIQAFEEFRTNEMSIEEVQARRAELRRRRELMFREEVRAKRIKKIKSKSYRRVHRRERERNAQREREAAVATGVEPDEAEQERLDRLRAEERMSGRHKAGKWSRSVQRTGRGAWDDDARDGVMEMARRDEELRRRIEGKEARDEDESSVSESESSNANSEDEDQDLNDKLDRLNVPDGTAVGAKLMEMKFMQKAENARKAQNDEDIDRLRRELAGEQSSEASDSEEEMSGRQRFGRRKDDKQQTTRVKQVHAEFEEKSDSENGDGEAGPEQLAEHGIEIMTEKPSQPPIAKSRDPLASKGNLKRRERDASTGNNVTENPWEAMSNRKHKHDVSWEQAHVEPQDTGQSTETSSPNHLRSKRQNKDSQENAISELAFSPADDDSLSGFSSKPETPEISEFQALAQRAFAGEDVATPFAEEKEGVAAEDAKALKPPEAESNAMPGWGSWTGAGLPKKYRSTPSTKQLQLKRQNVDLIKGKTDLKRRDALNPKAIVSERRIAKNAKYLATQLPHPFETKAQYERSLRIPVGPEWTTKDTFQRATKPRVMVKGGIIKPMEKPL